MNGVFAQPDGSEFPDWTHTDITGTEHNLYTYLDDGYTVIIDIFTTWCSNCVSSLPALHDLEEQYSAMGTGELMLFSFERDMNTTNEADWAANNNVTNPIFADALSTMETWNTFYQPNFFVICPDRSFELVVGSVANNNPLPDHVSACLAPPASVEEQQLEVALLSTTVGNELRLISNSQALNFVIYSLSGSVILRDQALDGVVNTRSLSEGLYLIQFSDGQSMVTRKFVKQ